MHNEGPLTGEILVVVQKLSDRLQGAEHKYQVGTPVQVGINEARGLTLPCLINPHQFGMNQAKQCQMHKYL